MKKFSKIWGVVVNNLKNPKNNQNKKISKALAFSLIELSIVLIIIGLLVAGVTGGKSLIESARQRAFINELSRLKQATFSFRTAKDRLPGDVNNLGRNGSGSKNTYTGHFSAPYDGSVYPIPNDYSAPFAELYLEKIIDFEPRGNSYTPPTSTTLGVPYSKILKDVYYYFWSGSCTAGWCLNIPEKYATNGIIRGIYYGASATKGYEPKLLKQLDKKIDDGEYNYGKLRGYCSSNSYDAAIGGDKKCSEIMFAL